MMLRHSLIFVAYFLCINLYSALAQSDKAFKQGEVVVKDSRNNIIERSYYMNDTLNGESIKWNTNGKLYSKSFYVMGILEGDWFHYDKKGTLDLYSHFNKGVRDIFKSYWSNGNERITALFLNGIIDGEMKTFFRDGKLESNVIYRQGKILSAMRIYRKDGTLKLIMFPLDSSRDMFIRKELIDKAGNVSKVSVIKDRPISYFLFGQEVHRSGPL